MTDWAKGCIIVIRFYGGVPLASGILGKLLAALIVGAAGGILSFVIGQSLPRKWFDFDAFPYRDFAWENGGRVYEKVKVRSWKDRVPDMSKFVPGMVKKKASLARNSSSMERLVRETCVAEAVHWALILIVAPVMGIFAGWLIALLYAVGNLLFVVIQRYNRPRLREILRRMEMRKRA